VAAGYLDEELKGRPTLKPDRVVLSLIRRRKNEEAAEKERLRQGDREGKGKGSGGKVGEDRSGSSRSLVKQIDGLQQLVFTSLGGQEEPEEQDEEA